MTELQVLVRETLQNSLDAWSRTQREFVEVHYRLASLIEDQKKSFLEALDITDYRKHMVRSRKYELRMRDNAGGNRSNDPAISEQMLKQLDPHDPATPLKLLYIEDQGATGLTGVEFDSEADSRFCACCRDAEFSVKEHRQSGGSHGKGKNVLWRHARSRIVLFHSTLSEPFNDQASRFFGVGKLPWHAIDREDRSTWYNGRCDFGRLQPEKTYCESILGDDGETIARRLGLGREGRTTGTTICLVGFDPLDEEETDQPTAQLIARIVEDYYWPAILEGRVAVKVTDDMTGETFEAEPSRREELQPYVTAYLAAKKPGDDNSQSRTVPIKPRDGSDRVSSRFSIGCTRLERPGIGTPRSDCAALIRGFGMVVNYKPIRPQRISAGNYAAVCLAGHVDPSAPLNPAANDPAAVLESLLATSEPEAHDRWDPKAFQGSDWHGAATALRKFNDQLKEAITELVCGDQQPHEGASMPELSKRFRLSGGPNTRPRSLSLQTHQNPEIRPDGTIAFRVKVNLLDNVSGTPESVRLRLDAYLLDTLSGRRRTQEKIPIESIHVGTSKLAFNESRNSANTTLDLAAHPLPATLSVIARVRDNGNFGRMHYGLKISGELVNETTGETS
jgi:hypothetical protein